MHIVKCIVSVVSVGWVTWLDRCTASGM